MSYEENMSLLDLGFLSVLGDNQCKQTISPQSELEPKAAYHLEHETKNVFNHEYVYNLTEKAYSNDNGFTHRGVATLPQYNDQHNILNDSNTYLQFNEANRIPANTYSGQNVYNTYNIQSNCNANKAIPASNKTVYTGVVKKQKRVRTAFTTEQILKLEAEYSRTKYLDRNRRVELSHTLSLSERTLKVWFQNRRMKEKKDKAEGMEDNEASSTIESFEDRPSSIHEWHGGNYAMVTAKFTREVQMLPMGNTTTTSAVFPNYFDENKINKFNTQVWDPNSTSQHNYQIQINGLALNTDNAGFLKSTTYDEDLDISLELLSELSE